MRQVWIPRIGGPEVLEVRQAPDPEPAAGEVRVRVAASGINFADLLARMGLYRDAPPLPAVVGYEVSGWVDRIGVGVTRLETGDRVACATRFGGYSDLVCVPADQVQTIPDSLDLEAAAAIPVTWLTAWYMLVRLGNLQPDERVLVHACAGGVGLAALQICRHVGATVIGIASPSKHDRLYTMGAAHCIDSRKRAFTDDVMRFTKGRGVDVVLDGVGGRSFTASYRVLADLGRLFLFGASGFAPGPRRSLTAAIREFVALPTFKPFDLMLKSRGVFGFNLGRLWHRAEESSSMLHQILQLFATGEFVPVVDRTFPFEKASEAHAYIHDRRNFGKVLLVP
jgi:NADPH:quinone reductase-like Zn-dependent oxidoreductase